MTVQAVDKRVIPEANLTSAGSSSQSPTSAEDAFLSVLQQATQRFANKTAAAVGASSGDRALAEHITRIRVETKVDTGDASADDGKAAVRDDRAAAKAEKKARAAEDSKSSRRADDKDAAPVRDDKDAAKVETDDAVPVEQEADAAQDVEAEQVEADATAAQDDQVIVAVEITVTETVSMVQVPVDNDLSGDEISTLAKAVQANLSGDDDATQAQDPLAGLSDDDRKRITDLESRLVNDVQQGDMDDALDAATQLIETLTAKVGEHKAAAKGTEEQVGDDLVDDQARDLAAMLSGTGIHLDVKVQTRTADATTTRQTASVVEAMTMIDAGAQGASLQAGNRDAQSGQGFAAADAPVTVDPSLLQAQAGTEDVTETAGQSFAAILAAQAEVSVADDAAPEQRGIAGLANVGAAQGADKASGAQSAQAAARTPRTAVAQQVMEQVSVQIDKQVKDGADTIKIQLKPVDLGKIEIKLEVASDGRVSATVTADKPETLAMLQKDAKGLEKALEDAGLKPDTSSTTFSLKGGEQQQNADRNNDNARSRRGRSGRQGGDDAQGASGLAAAQAARSQSLGGRSGVDISV